MSQLFLDQPLTFEKSAGLLTPLGDNVDKWPQQITQEVYKQLPFMSDFVVNVYIDRLSEERGFAFGSIDVLPKTDLTGSEQATQPVKSVTIPFVVRDRNLAPLDVFIEDKQYKPLTEGRMRSAMFRPDVFDAARDKPPEASLYQELQPPSEGGYGYGKIAALLPSLHGTVHEEHIKRANAEMCQPGTQVALSGANKGVQAAFESASKMTPSSPTKMAELISASLKPNVVQFTKTASGKYFLKHANTEAFAPQQQEVTQEQVQQMAGSDMTQQLEADGSVTVSPDATVKTTLEAEEIRNVDQPGLWLVQNTNGQKLTGWAFPRVLTLDLVPLPLTLFTNGSQYALQDKVAGRLVGKSADVPRGSIQGYGCLYYLDHGTPKVFLPMSVRSAFQGPDGLQWFQCVDDMGEPATFSFMAGMKTPVRVSQDRWVVPDFFKWLPLSGQVQLIDSAESFTKFASKGGTAELFGSENTFHLRGPAFAKLAQDEKQFLSPEQTMFLGVAAGMSPEFVKSAMKEANRGKLVKVAGLKTIRPYAEVMREENEKVAGLMKKATAGLNIRNYCLVKEAAVLDDALTADKILGLGFLNAENVSTFVDLLPGLEYASSKIAEMLFASRIGLKDIPESALERMMAALEDVIQGLKTLKQQDMSSQVMN